MGTHCVVLGTLIHPSCMLCRRQRAYLYVLKDIFTRWELLASGANGEAKIRAWHSKMAHRTRKVVFLPWLLEQRNIVAVDTANITHVWIPPLLTAVIVSNFFSLFARTKSTETTATPDYCCCLSQRISQSYLAKWRVVAWACQLLPWLQHYPAQYMVRVERLLWPTSYPRNTLTPYNTQEAGC